MAPSETCLIHERYGVRGGLIAMDLERKSARGKRAAERRRIVAESNSTKATNQATKQPSVHSMKTTMGEQTTF